MYSYTLILKDSSKYESIEKSDIFVESTIGTWTIWGLEVRLNPKKELNSIISEKVVQEKIIINPKEEVVIIETATVLVVTSENRFLKLERRK